MPKSRLSAVLSLLLVFLSGAVLGAFAYRLYSISSVQSGKDTGGPPQQDEPGGVSEDSTCPICAPRSNSTISRSPP